MTSQGLSVILPEKAIRSPLPCGACVSRSWDASGSQPCSRIGKGNKVGDTVKLSESLGLRCCVLVLCATLSQPSSAWSWTRVSLTVLSSSSKPERLLTADSGVLVGLQSGM